LPCRKFEQKSCPVNAILPRRSQLVHPAEEPDHFATRIRDGKQNGRSIIISNGFREFLAMAQPITSKDTNEG
jgi:hypothetical protein